MAATKYFNRDEAYIEQRESEHKARIKAELKLEDKMEAAFKPANPTQEFYDCVFELMELRKW